MRRFVTTIGIVCCCVSLSWADDAEKAKSKDAPADSKAELETAADPDDQKSFNEFMTRSLQSIYSVLQTDVDQAEKRLQAFTKVINGLEAQTDDGKRNVTRAKSTVQSLKDTIELQRTTLADLEAQVEANPQDLAVVNRYFRKATGELASLARTQPDKAAEILNLLKARLEKIQAATESESGKKSVERMVGSLGSYERAIESGRKMAALIGKDAAPLDVEAWANGESLTDSDLKGKVVLLDFWAVWCGPCIATFPHLREWQEKYAEKGLVIIGLTRYYNYDWNEDAKQARRSQAPVSPEAEQAMLKKFAEQHKLEHRFGIQSKDSKLPEYYGVTGIPHVVVIDRAGKVRLMRVGSGEANAKAIGEMLEKLLSEPATATGG